MPADAAIKWVVTANYTASGSVAYVRADKSVTGNVAEAAVFDSKDDAEAMRKQALSIEAVVADPYLMEVSVTDNGLDLLTARERIRSKGPTVRVRRPDPQAVSS